MIWRDFEFVIHLACIIKTRILDIIWPCLLTIMIMTWVFEGILFICALVVSFAALALRARTANDTTQAQINNIPSKSHVNVYGRQHLSQWTIITTGERASESSLQVQMYQITLFSVVIPWLLQFVCFAKCALTILAGVSVLEILEEKKTE